MENLKDELTLQTSNFGIVIPSVFDSKFPTYNFLKI